MTEGVLLDQEGLHQPDERDVAEASIWHLGLLLLRMSWPFRGRFLLTALLAAGRASCLALLVYSLDKTVQHVTPEALQQAPLHLLLAAAGVLACQLGAAVCQYFSDEAQRWFLAGVELATFRWAIDRLLLLPADYFRTRSLLKFVLHLDKLQLAVRAFLGMVTTAATRVLAIVGIVSTVLTRSPLYAVLGLSMLGLVSFLAWRRTSRLRQLAREELRTDLGFIDRTLAIFSNLHDLHGLGLRDQALSQFDEACSTWTARTLRMARIQSGGGAIISVIGIVLLAGVLGIALGMGGAAAGAITAFVAMTMLLEPLGELVRIHIAMQTKVAKLGDIFEFNEGRFNERRQHDGQIALAEPIISIRLENVAYELAGVPLLADVHLEARRGEIIGIIGRSGAGKTTLAHILLRLLDPTSGTYLINDKDSRHISLASFWSQTSAVTQIPVRLESTLAEEVAWVYPQAASQALEDALKEAGIDPQLRHEPLEELGQHREAVWHTRSLQQRVEWARVWLRPASLVVFDEPTSLCDPTLEQRFLQSLLRRRHGWITFLISHRPATLAVCDRLIVVECGRIVAQGPRKQILAQWMPTLESEGVKAG